MLSGSIEIKVDRWWMETTVVRADLAYLDFSDKLLRVELEDVSSFAYVELACLS